MVLCLPSGECVYIHAGLALGIGIRNSHSRYTGIEIVSWGGGTSSVAISKHDNNCCVVMCE